MVTVSYIGTHQAFQIALAAQEAEVLEKFYVSVFDAPGKWGRKLGIILGSETLINRRCAGLLPGLVHEIPLPFLRQRISAKFAVTGAIYPWYVANFDFDHKVAQHLERSSSRIFIGTETCCWDSFRAADRRGMFKILDCPQVHPAFLTRLLHRAADDLQVPAPPPFDVPELARRKAEEFEMADKLLVISDVHQRSFVEAGFSKTKMVKIPLWVDSALWFQNPKRTVSDAGPLKVLFVGNVGLRKGIPYLVRAMEQCGQQAELTLVGVNSGETDRFISQSKAKIHVAGQKNKLELRKLYWQHDLAVLPSLIDTFGFVALEAMACGLPVIVTENCGVPVPDTAWRVPIMNSEAIAQRLEHYIRNREALSADGIRAAEFAKQFTPERYREGVKTLLTKILQG